MNSTICAISTPPGVGGIAVARISGPQAIDICQRIWRGANITITGSHTAHLGTVTDQYGNPLDQAVATVFRAPHSFTGEDVVELSIHGSKYIQQQLINTLIAMGASLAQPGEFTRRAFAAGKMDLAQAESIADIIASENRAQHRIAINQMRGEFSGRLRALRDRLIDLASLLELELDFSEEDVEFANRQQLLDIATEVSIEVNRLSASFANGQVIKDGIPVAIIGATNAGKSSLLNSLLGDDRAIVSDIHGTTRDIVEDTLNIGDYTFRIMDTAGLRSTPDTIESMGIERSLRAAQRARILLVVIDRSDPQIPQLPETEAHIIVVQNKKDLTPAPGLDTFLDQSPLRDADNIEISALDQQGIDELKSKIEAIARQSAGDNSAILVTNARHYEALIQASKSIGRAIDALRANLSGDLIAIDIRQTIHHLGSILGEITSQDILTTIFSRFCIGK